MGNSDFKINIERSNDEVDVVVDVESIPIFLGAIAVLIHEVSVDEQDAFNMLNLVGQAVSEAYKENIPKAFK